MPDFGGYLNLRLARDSNQPTMHVLSGAEFTELLLPFAHLVQELHTRIYVEQSKLIQ